MFAVVALQLLLVRVVVGECVVTKELGCFEDTSKDRLLPVVASFGTNPNEGDNSKETCAQLCCNAGLCSPDDCFGVEFGAQCFCGHAYSRTPTPESLSDCAQYRCPGNHTEDCGGSDRISVFHAKCSGPAVLPAEFHGCVAPEAKALPYCNTHLSHAARVKDILSRLTTAQKIALLSPTEKPFCACHTAPIPSIGMPKYKWLTEVNSCVSTQCVARDKCPTTFVGPTGMAASFNRTSWYLKGDVVSTDLRAFNSKQGSDIGLTGFGPNINMVKDPRYGRNSELAGEDPYLSGTYGASYTQGMQQVKNGYQKMHSYLKHYTAYNVETNRFVFKAPVSNFSFFDTYLPQYEKAMVEGKSSGVMCSYFAPNGLSSCGNRWLLTDMLRTRWGRSDAVVMSDCSAVANMMKNGGASGPENASAKALNAGMDVYGGWNDDLWTSGYLEKAIKDGLATVATLDAAVSRTLMQKMTVGLFDPPSANPWSAINHTDLNTTYSQRVAYEAALQGIVLLKNDRGLPLKAGLKLAVVGPLADTAGDLISDYETAHMCYGGGYACMPTIASALAATNVGGHTEVAPGVDVDSANTTGIAAALTTVKHADATVLVLGITKKQEHEGIDRKDTLLPGLQQSFAHQVFAAAGGRPVVVVVCNGGILSIDTLVGPSAAVVEAFNPAQQGPLAIARTFFGHENRWGKLPVTIYNKSYSDLIKLTDMELTTPPGRSYRYYQDTPLFPFGMGLSLTTFTLSCDPVSSNTTHWRFACIVANTGSYEGDEVVMVFARASDAIRRNVTHPVPFKKLIEFERVRAPVSGSASIVFNIERQSLSLVDASGASRLYPGEHDLVFSRGHGTDVTHKIVLS